jgi:hypothetical protein
MMGLGARVFISYSRSDLAIAEQIADILNQSGFNAYLDLHDIAPGEPWRECLSTLIASAEKGVFLISPESVVSGIRAWEVEYAESLDKNLLPISIRETPEDAIPGRLSRFNFLFMRTEAERAQACISAIHRSRLGS